MDFTLNLRTEAVTAAHPAEPLVVEEGMAICDVLALLKLQRAGSVLICRQGQLNGIFTERDALRLMAAGADLDQPIEVAMSATPATVSAEATVAAAISKMAEGGYRRLPIVDAAGQPRGVLKASGIVRYLSEHFPQTIYNLPPSPNAVPQQREGA